MERIDLGNGYHIEETFTLRSDAVIESQTIPLYDLHAIAGLTSLFVDKHIPLEEIQVPNMPKCDGAVFVKGDSMTPLLRAGDIVCYKTVQSRRGGLFFGEMYLLSFDMDGEEYITIKYVHQSDIPGHYKLISHNPKHPPRDVPVDSVRAMALVKASIRLNAMG